MVRGWRRPLRESGSGTVANSSTRDNAGTIQSPPPSFRAAGGVPTSRLFSNPKGETALALLPLYTHRVKLFFSAE
jgi:hypothetical protein